MRVLLDESLPRPLAPEITGHEVFTVRQMGWAGVHNGELLLRAAAAGFDAFVTADRNLEFQQNIGRVGLGVVVLIAPSNDREDILPLAPQVIEALATIGPGQVVQVGQAPRRGRGSRRGRRNQDRAPSASDDGRSNGSGRPTDAV